MILGLDVNVINGLPLNLNFHLKSNYFTTLGCNLQLCAYRYNTEHCLLELTSSTTKCLMFWATKLMNLHHSSGAEVVTIHLC